MDCTLQKPGISIRSINMYYTATLHTLGSANNSAVTQPKASRLGPLEM
jgi:hypothetical protein